ncbi:MAG: TadE/TadG family type IV pilus assembly protein [Pseudomonadota bacterium]
MSVKSFCQNVMSAITNDGCLGTPWSNKAKLNHTSALKPVGEPSLSKRFVRDEGGNVAMLFGLGSLILFISAGLAVDFSRYNLVYGDLVESMDAAGLAIAQYEAGNEDIEDAELKIIGRRFFDENFRYANLVDDLTVDFIITNSRIEPRVTGTMDALILQTIKIGAATFNFNNFDLGTSTEITKKGSGRIELALVLDVTGSMGDPADGSSGGESKLDNLKSSVDIMLQTLYGDSTTDDNLKLSVVPFNAHVNVGNTDEIQSASWLDQNGEAFYNGARFIHAVYPTENDLSQNARVENSNGTGSGIATSTGIPKLIDPDTRVNHFDLYASSSSLEWKGCVEARPYPLDEIDLPSNGTISASEIDALIASVPKNVDDSSATGERTEEAFDNMPALTVDAATLARAENALFVPIFAPDGVTCENNGDPCFNLSTSGSISNSAYTLPHSVYWRDFIYDKPSDEMYSSDETYSNYDYGQNDFVRDWSFAKPGAGSNRDAVYADIVRSSRMALWTPGTDTYWQSVKSRLLELDINNAGKDEFILRNAYVGLYDPTTKTYNLRYDDSVTYNVGGNIGPNPNCPPPIVPLTSTRSTIRNAVQALTAGGTTNSAMGAMWGWRTLSPEPPFEEGVSYENGQWQKVVVLMTDGQNVVSKRYTHHRSDLNAYGMAREERMGSGIDEAWKMRNEIDNKMLRICQRMKDENILVYSVMFGLDTTDEESSQFAVNQRVEDLYKACASSPEAPFFHNVLTGADLENAFEDVAADLVRLHISR